MRISRLSPLVALLVVSAAGCRTVGVSEHCLYSEQDVEEICSVLESTFEWNCTSADRRCLPFLLDPCSPLVADLPAEFAAGLFSPDCTTTLTLADETDDFAENRLEFSRTLRPKLDGLSPTAFLASHCDAVEQVVFQHQYGRRRHSIAHVARATDELFLDEHNSAAFHLIRLVAAPLDGYGIMYRSRRDSDGYWRVDGIWMLWVA